ncbi:hypothetical protein RJ640_009510 [Escallonia rubra]|uniref:Ribulose bisphosphate carboxylase small subunit n=1 Tax=Escallonia rubra TaxID=112253 RepID=A0AA88RGI8_9ASTE|nr:hypothetical protein RJ640_009510 [Escallonia rubra]
MESRMVGDGWIYFFQPRTEGDGGSESEFACDSHGRLGMCTGKIAEIPNYYDGRYWTLWKLPMFACNDPSQVLHEIQECKKTYPNAYIRCLAFDNLKQAQCMSFVIQKPTIS